MIRRLLLAAQGVFDTECKKIYRCFPLYAHHIRDTQTFNPSDFHAQLCEKIRNAKRRVLLASLYVGPAACSASRRELELLDALQLASRSVDVKILMDRNRALRKIPSASHSITSAEACYAALCQAASDGTGIYLLSVLPASLQSLLPNPYNEAAGVFHIKAYIIDDELILSGANLSEEYFSDRIDRYLWLQLGANGLVDFYKDLFDALCHHSEVYDPTRMLFRKSHKPSSIKDFMNRIESVLSTSDNPVTIEEVGHVVAYAIPTFQAPPHYYHTSKSNSVPQDCYVINSLLNVGASDLTNAPHRFTVRLSTAYLNLTDSMQTVLSEKVDRVHILTAGKISHGFKRKEKAGNKGKEWITSVFDSFARQTAISVNQSLLWFYQRAGWSFHAKGMWFCLEKPHEVDNAPGGLAIADPFSLVAVTHGSSNYGRRSAQRDMESNLIMILNRAEIDSEPTTLQRQLSKEWNFLCQHAMPFEKEDKQTLSWTIRLVLPWIRSFF